MSFKNIKIKFFLSFALFAVAFSQSGCGFFDEVVNNITSVVGLSDTATVIAQTAWIRSSYSVVASDLLEVKRGETLEVLDQTEFEKVIWYRVRAKDEDKTEGWIEAQNVITGELMEKSKILADATKNLQTQATGQLRAASNLRLSPDLTPENALFRLANGSTFEITAWKFVPKAQNVSDVDDATKGEQKAVNRSKNEEIEAAKEKDEPEKLDEKYDVWYQVRLDPSVSPAPAGWLFGRQVELQLPGDIAFFQANNKKFVTWHRIDNEPAGSKEKATPGSWIVLTRTNVVKAIDGIEPDFDGILVLGFDKYDQSHYTVYRTINDVWGLLPLKVDGTGDNKTFTIQLRANGGGMQEKRFVIFKDRNRIKLTLPEDIANFETKPAR